jgi:hypothetical protein
VAEFSNPTGNASEVNLAMWQLWRGDLDPARDLLHEVINVSVRQGSEESANDARLHLIEVERRSGNWNSARTHAEACARWSRETGFWQEGVPAYVVSLVDAGCGEVDRARVLAAKGVGQAEAQQDWTFAAQCRWVLGQVELSVDDPAAAMRWLEPVADMLQIGGIGEPGGYPFTPDLIEAWAATGYLDRAEDRLAWLQDAARRLDHPWARITAGRAEASLRLAEHDPAAAVAAVDAVIAEARERRLPFELGRCLLVLGTASARPASAAGPLPPWTRRMPPSPASARQGGGRWPQPSGPGLRRDPTPSSPPPNGVSPNS